MIKVTIILDNQIKDIGLNNEQVCSFRDIEIIHPETGLPTTVTEVRMSNGDQWNVLIPPYEEWLIDTCIT